MKRFFIILVASWGVAVAIHLALSNKTEQPTLSSTPTYYNGEILYPDYVQQDTLIVTDAQYLNNVMADPDFDASDDTIAEILSHCTTIMHKPDYSH